MKYNYGYELCYLYSRKIQQETKLKRQQERDNRRNKPKFYELKEGATIKGDKEMIKKQKLAK